MDQTPPSPPSPPSQPSQPSQPQWTPPPQQPAGWGAPGYGGPPARPMGVTLGSIFLIVMGVLMALAGAACGLFGGTFAGVSGQDTSGLLGALAGAALIGGVIILVLGILQIAAGAGALGGKGWARWTGTIVSIIFAILLALGGISSLTAENGVTSAIISIVLAVAYAGTAFAFVKANAYFAYRR